MLYTKKGDGGTTKLFDCPQGVRVSKSDFAFEVLGTLDEINSSLGYAKVLAEKGGISITFQGKVTTYVEILEKLQENLFSIQGEVAGADTHIKMESVTFEEEVIAEIERHLTPITSFIISGGTELGAYLDVCRTIARKSERYLVTLKEKNERKINEESMIFMNRLSSILYALARYANQKSNVVEKGPSYNN